MSLSQVTLLTAVLMLAIGLPHVLGHPQAISYLESGSVDRGSPTPSVAPDQTSAEEGALP